MEKLDVETVSLLVKALQVAQRNAGVAYLTVQGGTVHISPEEFLATFPVFETEHRPKRDCPYKLSVTRNGVEFYVLLTEEEHQKLLPSPATDPDLAAAVQKAKELIAQGHQAGSEGVGE